MTLVSRAAFTLSRLKSTRSWPWKCRSQLIWWKWKCASVQHSALLYTTATPLVALSWPVVTRDCLVGWAFPLDCPDVDACLTSGFPSWTPSAWNSALSFPGRQAPKAKRTPSAKGTQWNSRIPCWKLPAQAARTTPGTKSTNDLMSSSEEWIWLQTSTTHAPSGVTLPKPGSRSWGSEPGTTIDLPWDPCTPGHAAQADPQRHPALTGEQAQMWHGTARSSLRPGHTKADGSTGYGPSSLSASCPEARTYSWDMGTYHSPPYPSHSDDGHQRTHLVAVLTLPPH